MRKSNFGRPRAANLTHLLFPHRFLRDGIWPERREYFEAMSRFFPALNEASDSMSVAVNLEKTGICARIFPGVASRRASSRARP